jgi:hypothetical protein
MQLLKILFLISGYSIELMLLIFDDLSSEANTPWLAVPIHKILSGVMLILTI